MMRRSAASSSGVHEANERCFSAATSDAIQPSGCSRVSSAGPGSLPGMTNAASASSRAVAVIFSWSLAADSAPRK